MSLPDRHVVARIARLAATLAVGATLWAPSASAASPGPEPSPTSAPAQPAGTLQALIDGTPSGATLVVPPGLYRESVVITAPIVLDGTSAEIRGSDPWDTWQATPDGWRSAEPVPELEAGGVCRDARCAWPEQVFLDGAPLEQVAADPAPGEFALDAERHVVLEDDPTGRSVEVTTRPRWMVIEAPDVEVRGFTMRHAASPAQSGGLQARRGADRLTVREVVLEDAHGALVSFQDVADASLLDSVLRRGGQLAVHAGGEGTSGLTVARNQILDSNTEGFDPAWEAGGLKAALATGLSIEDNVVTGNDGAGLWCDIDCRDVRYAGNRVGHNANVGIMFEISDGAVIEGNVIWENGWAEPSWGWGAGILVSSSTDAVVRDNVLAWNADGISVISQRREREGGDAVRAIEVSGNTVINGPAGGFLLAWLQDWDGPMFREDAGNVGTGNAFWLDEEEAATCDFEWDGCRDTLTAFAATPGGEGSRLLAATEREAALSDAGIEESPAPHRPQPEPFRPRELLRPSVLVPVGLLVVAVITGVAVILLVRRRQRRPSAPP